MQLKVLCLNMWDGGRLLSSALQYIKQSDPDILLLQEVYDSDDIALEDRFQTLSILKEKLPHKHNFFSAEFIDNRKEGKIPQGNAIFSKFPIVNQKTVFFDRPFDENYVEKPENFPTISRNLQCAVLESPGGELNVFNFHGVWDLDGDNCSNARQKMAETILLHINNQKRVILAGDTNAKFTNSAFQNINKELTSVFGSTLSTTFNMSRKDNPGYATASVDMMFISSEFKVVSKEASNVDISDHLPLKVVLSL